MPIPDADNIAATPATSVFTNRQHPSCSQTTDDVFDEEQEQDYLEQELERVGLVEPPDGGWGWVVVLGSFFANVLVDGVIFTAGAGFQPEWERQFGASSSATALVVSMLSGCYLLAGPLASALANYFGCRLVTFAGTILASCGFFLSIFAPNLPCLYLTFGLMGGIGFGLIFLPAIVIVSYYFKKRRALATGLAVCGSGIGTFIFAPLNQYLLTHYSWQQAVMIISALVLNCLVCGSVFRPLQPSNKQVDKVREIAIEYSQHVTSQERIGSFSSRHRPVLPRIKVDDYVDVEPSPTHLHSNSNPDGHTTVLDSPQVGRVVEGAEIERISPVKRGSRTRTITAGRPFVSLMELNARRRHLSFFEVDKLQRTEPVTSVANLADVISRDVVHTLNRPMSRMDIFYAGSCANLDIASAAHARSRGMSVLSLAPTVLPEGDDYDSGSGWARQIVAVLKGMLDLSLLRSASFVVIAIQGSLTLCGFFVPFIYISRQALTIGASDSQATMLVSILGVTNIVARIFCGWLSDRPNLDALMIHNVAVTLGGVATIAVPFLTQYWMLCVYCVVFGFGTACFASLRSIICVELLGLERLTSAFGFMLLFMGFAALIGSPIAGFLYDVTGNYTLSFIVMGSLIALSGLLGVPLRAINRWEFNLDDRRNVAQSPNGRVENGQYDEEELKELSPSHLRRQS